MIRGIVSGIIVLVSATYVIREMETGFWRTKYLIQNTKDKLKRQWKK